MILSPGPRKLTLAVHLSCSVGWIGAVVAYLVLDLTVAASADAALVRGAWMAMGLIVSMAIVPLALASLVTGLVISLGTKWGLFRHWWVLISLILTVVATVVLLSETRVVTQVAAVVARPGMSDQQVLAYPPTLVHSVGGLIVLLVIQVLNVYKPPGVTPYGWRKQQEERQQLARRAADRVATPSAADASELEETT
jgi:hypothetical protein